MSYFGNRMCLECEKPFERWTRGNVRYCSDACKQAAYRKRRAETEGRPYYPTSRPIRRRSSKP